MNQKNSKIIKILKRSMYNNFNIENLSNNQLCNCLKVIDSVKLFSNKIHALQNILNGIPSNIEETIGIIGFSSLIEELLEDSISVSKATNMRCKLLENLNENFGNINHTCGYNHFYTNYYNVFRFNLVDYKKTSLKIYSKINIKITYKEIKNIYSNHIKLLDKTWNDRCALAHDTKYRVSGKSGVVFSAFNNIKPILAKGSDEEKNLIIFFTLLSLQIYLGLLDNLNS